MRNQDRPEGSGEQPLPAEQLSPEARREVRRAALLRPVNLLVAAIGGVFFALSLGWWSIPLTLVTCAVLLFLTMRDARFVESVLEGRENRSGLQRQATGAVDVSPDRRARWLPRGETRQKVEAALEVQRRIMLAIRESDDVVRAVLDDALPKLDGVAERLVDIAHTREKVDGAIQDLKARPGAPYCEDEDAYLVKL